MKAGWLRNFLLIATLLAVTGGQWALLQSAAWAGMLVHNLRTQTLSTAVAQTFDGQHPCPLCKAIERGKKSEKKSEFESPITRLEFPPIDVCCGPKAEEPAGEMAVPVDEFAESLSAPPLLRPPRATFA